MHSDFSVAAEPEPAEVEVVVLVLELEEVWSPEARSTRASVDCAGAVVDVLVLLVVLVLGLVDEL